MYQVIRYNIFSKQVKIIKEYEKRSDAIYELERRQALLSITKRYQYKYNIKESKV